MIYKTGEQTQDEALGIAFRAARKRKGISQHAAAERLGVPRWCIFELEQYGLVRTHKRLEAIKAFVGNAKLPPAEEPRKPTAFVDERPRSSWAEDSPGVKRSAAAHRNDVLLNKAELCVQVARALLAPHVRAWGADAEKVIESQAIALMHLPEDDLRAMGMRMGGVAVVMGDGKASQ